MFNYDFISSDETKNNHNVLVLNQYMLVNQRVNKKGKEEESSAHVSILFNLDWCN